MAFLFSINFSPSYKGTLDCPLLRGLSSFGVSFIGGSTVVSINTHVHTCCHLKAFLHIPKLLKLLVMLQLYPIRVLGDRPDSKPFFLDCWLKDYIRDKLLASLAAINHLTSLRDRCDSQIKIVLETISPKFPLLPSTPRRKFSGNLSPSMKITASSQCGHFRTRRKCPG